MVKPKVTQAQQQWAVPRPTGHVRRRTVLGVTLYISPDLMVWVFPSAISVALAAGALAAAHDVPMKHGGGVLEILVFLYLTLGALTYSALCGLTDPGFIPKPTAEAPDPYADETHLQMCRFCHLRRPPRTSHCHVCDMCVFDHDHHCGVIGGCVGARSLRWFTLYLTHVSSAAAVAFSWVLRSLLASNIGDIALGGTVKLGGTAAPATTTAAPHAHDGSRRYRHHRAGEALDGTKAIHIVLLIFIGNVVLLVGGLGLYYLYLLCSDTTRREAQRGRVASAKAPAATLASGEAFNGYYYHEEAAARKLAQSWAWRHLGHFGRQMFPLPSLLSAPAAVAHDDSQLRDITGDGVVVPSALGTEAAEREALVPAAGATEGQAHQ
jgi:hypothetical protein